MTVILPDPRGKQSPEQLIEHLIHMNEALKQELERYVPKRTAVPAIYLQSNGGYVYEVTVDNAGNLVTTVKYSP